MSERWICTDLKLLNEGKEIEATFESTRSKITRMTVCYSADHWVEGSMAAFRLARFEEAMKETVKILEGRA